MTHPIYSIAIDQLSNDNFEEWAQIVLQIVKGLSFDPTGGMHDGGQDGFIRQEFNSPTHFIQISKQKDTSAKVRMTIRRIQESRSIEKLTYVTSQEESEKDLLEAKIKRDLGVEVVIHDKRWLLIQSTVHERAGNTLLEYSKPLVEGLQKIKEKERKLNSDERLRIVVYLESEAQSLPHSENFQTLCLDTLIYHALENTDPSKNKFMEQSEIEEFIRSVSPKVLAKSPVNLTNRLEFLSSKENDPRIRRHPINKYALPFEVRNSFDDKNLAIENSEDAFMGSVNTRLNLLKIEEVDKFRPFIVSSVKHAIMETYRQQAINFLNSFHKQNFETDIRVFDIISTYLKEFDLSNQEFALCFDVSSLLVRHICYSAKPAEIKFITYLMKYYTLRFLMDGDETISQYFSDMAKRLRLFVGTDIIVRCLSETLVNKSSQAMTNTIRMLKEAGVQLFMPRQVANEVYFHICNSDTEFQLHYASWYRHATLDVTKNIGKILIRAFFYAYLEPEKHATQPRNWSHYLSFFGSANWFSGTKSNEDDFTSFLLEKFGFDFIEADEVREAINAETVSELTDKVLELRDSDSDGAKILAQDDAEIALFVDNERTRLQERVTTDLYGINTWWLTEETKILSALKALKQRSDVVMHPQFLVNHYILDPTVRQQHLKKEDVIMPTVFGLRITDRMSSGDMTAFVEQIGDLAGLDEIAIRAKIRQASNELKKRTRFNT